MKKLLSSIEKLKKGKIRKLVDKRIKEFKNLGKKSSSELFKELCFCILTANSTAEQCIKVHCRVGDDFLTLNQSSLQKKLKSLGCRFHTKRAAYISESNQYKKSLKNIIQKLEKNEKRDWLVKNIKGLGYKEASHFLRNIGCDDYAIIDFHIADILVKNKLIKRPKTLNKNHYIEIEKKIREISKKLKITLAELDLYLWYLETGKILK
ncbi:N-glycosylase/DNA lyase [Candidatus Woesearchaeota archaeon]|nr:N-glycosylase/DNA lyase [Candidatus Woesearchaeota archaeon]